MVDALLIKNDLYYTDPTPTQMGFMLAKDKRGTKLWRRDDERALPDSFAAGDISYANLSPDIQKVISHRYMHGGLGALEFEVEDDELYQILRYLRSQNLDLRCKGKAYPGPKIAAMTLETISDDGKVTLRPMADGDLIELTPSAGENYACVDEIDVDEADYVDCPTISTKTDVYKISRCWGSGTITGVKVYTRVNGENAAVKFYETIKTHGTLYYGTEVDGAGDWADSDHTWATNPNTSAAWTWAEIKALQIGIKITNTAIEFDAHCAQVYAEVTFTDADLTPCFAVYNGEHYMAAGHHLMKANAAGTAFADVKADFAEFITHIEAFGDYLLIAVGAGNKYWYMDAAEAFTESGLAAAQSVDRFCKVGTDLWQLVWPNKIRKATDPTDTGAWGSEITVGEAAYDVNDMQLYDGYLYCLKEEGVFYEDGAGAIVEPFPELRSIAHADSGKNSTTFRAGLYFRMGNQQEWELKGGVLTEITPEIFAPSINKKETEILRPNAAGDETAIEAQFPDSDAHWDKVDEEEADDSSTNVHTATDAYQRDLYSLPDFAGTGAINKITVYFRCGSAIGGDGNATAKASIKSGVTVADGDEETLPVGSYTTYSMEWATNPDDGAAWEWADIDALQIGVSLKSGTHSITPRASCTQVYVVVEFSSHYAHPCVAKAHDESWLYALLKRGGGDLAILSGRWEYVAGRSRWIWHEIRSIDLTDVAMAFVCSVEGRPYLYLASTVATESVYKVYLPITNDATADGDYRFHTAGSLWTPRYMTLLFAVIKRWQEVFMRSLNLTADNYINVYYSTDDGASFTLLKKFDTSPEQTEAFTNIEATMMNLRFDFVGDSETVPPVLKYFNLKAMTRMPSVAKFRHTVKCADNLLLKKNVQSNTTVAAIAAYINGIRDKVCTLGDVDGVEHTVMVKVVKDYEAIDFETNRPIRLYDIEAIKL